MIDENIHGSVGAIEVLVSGLNRDYGITEELIRLNGQTPIQLANHYHRINELKVVTVGRQLSNQGDIYISALDGVRASTLLKLADYVSAGVPTATQKIYAKIPGGDNRMLSSHYTVPRSHTLYIESIHIITDVATISNWKLKSGVNGSLHTLYKGRVSSSFPEQAQGIINFKYGYTFPGGSDIKLTIDTVGGTTDVTSKMDGYLISQVQLELENEARKEFVSQVVAEPLLAPTFSAVTREEELEEERYMEDDYTDEQFSDIPDYGGLASEDSYGGSEDTGVPDDTEAYEEECEDGYTWCDALGECISVESECV